MTAQQLQMEGYLIAHELLKVAGRQIPLPFCNLSQVKKRFPVIIDMLATIKYKTTERPASCRVILLTETHSSATRSFQLPALFMLPSRKRWTVGRTASPISRLSTIMKCNGESQSGPTFTGPDKIERFNCSKRIHSQIFQIQTGEWRNWSTKSVHSMNVAILWIVSSLSYLKQHCT